MSSLRSTVRHAAGKTLRSSPAPVQDALRRGSGRLLAALGNPPMSALQPPSEPGVASEPVWRSPDLPLPEGLTFAQLDAAMKTWSIDGEPAGHMTDYVNDSICRFLHTWSLARSESGRCLELGANPYFTTYLLDKHSDLELTLANYFGQSGETTQTVSYLPPGGVDRVEVKYTCAMYNVEEDEFPYPTDSFNVVLFCEMLEHLLMNPLATLRQIHRILAPGGLLILTTPNVARIGNVTSMIVGTNIYDPYSGFGPYGRHNREYTMRELHRLLEFAGFEVERSFTADGHPSDPLILPRYHEVAPLLKDRDDLGHYLFVGARTTGTARTGLPSFLYRSYPAGEIVDYM